MRSTRSARAWARSSMQRSARSSSKATFDRLWEMIQEDGLECYDAAHFADYGTEAVGTLLR